MTAGTMKIGIDATSWFNGRGYGRYTREILPNLVAAGPDHEFVLFVESRNASKVPDLGSNVRVHPVECSEAPSEAAAAEGYRSPRDLLRFTAAVRDERPDITYFPTVYSYFPLPRDAKALVTVHDAIAERFPELTLPTWRDRLFWKLKVWLALRQSRLVLTVSEFAADDISARLGVDRGRLRVTSEAPADTYRKEVSGADLARAHEIAGLPQGARWFTYVGGFSPHKRLDVIVRAHARIVREVPDPPHLLLVGTLSGDGFHGCRAQLLDLVAEEGTGERVHWTGFVPDEDLRALHAGSLACLLPSECEGFGLPAVEAAACGAPVIATTQSPLPQLLAGGGSFVRPGDVDALHAAMRLLCVDPDARRVQGAQAQERAHALSWQGAARAALAALEEAVA